MTPTHPTPQQRREIAVLALMPERQVLRVYRDPARCKPTTVSRVELAANKLGLPAPTVRR